jgi:hypothetical protein
MKLVAAGVFCIALAMLSLVMTYPLVTDMAHTVPGPPGDNFEYVYKLWWFEHALFERNQSPFFIPEVFYPFGYELSLSETTLANTVPGLPLTAVFGEVAAYNLLLLWSFVLSGLGAYLLARYLTGSMAAALLAGLIFAFLPYRTALVGSGHLPLMGTGWLPLLLLYEERVIRHRRARDGALAGLFYGLFALSSWYYAYMGALVAVLYALARARPWSAYLRDRRAWRSLLIAACVAILVMLPALAPLLSLTVRGEIGRPTVSLRYIDQWSASFMDFFLPSIMHPLWGEQLAALYPQNVHENLLWLGAIPMILAAYAVIRRRSALTGALAVVGCAAFVLALGTTLHWAGEPVYIPVWRSIADLFTHAMYAITGKYALNPATYSGMEQAGHIVVPLPTLALYLFLPFFNAMRVWARFGLVVGLVVAVLAGMGASALVRWPRWTRRARIVLVALLAAGVLFDFATVPYPFGMSAVGPQPVDEWLRAQPGDFAILELPISKTWHGPPLYAAREHGKKIAYGYGTYMPAAYRAWQQRLAGFPDDESLQAIKEAGIRYVLVGWRSYGQQEQTMRTRLAATPHLRLVFSANERPVLSGDRLMKLVHPSAIVPPSEMIGAVRYAYLVDEIAVYELAD